MGTTRRGEPGIAAGGRYRALGLLHIMNDGWLASLPLLLPFLRGELGLDYAGIGILTSLLGAAGIFLALPAAGLARRFGGFRVLAAAAILYAASFLVVAAARSYGALALAFGLASLGFGAFHPIGFSLTASAGPSASLGKRMGGFTAVGDIGRIGVAALVTALMAWLSWRRVAVIYAAVPILVLAACLAGGLFREVNDTGTHGLPDTGKNRKFRLSVDRRLAPILASGFIDTLAGSSLFVFLPFLFTLRGASPGLLGSLSGAFFLGNMLGKVALGGTVDRFGGRRVFFVSEFVMAALLVALGRSESLAVLVPLSVLLGAVTKGTVPVINTLLAEAAGEGGGVEEAFALGSTLNGVAGVISPLLFGLVSERFGVDKVFPVSAAFAVLAVLPLLITRKRGAARS